MAPSLAADPYGVALVGEALGADEAESGRPFVGKAGFKLTRLIQWAGLDRERFDIWNTVWCRPPNNKLEGEAYESGAIAHCRSSHWETLLSRVRVAVPMGNVATGALTGRKGILSIRGYVQGGPNGTHIIPTVHPAFIARGQSKWSAAFIADLRKAVELADGGLPPQIVSYLIDPSPSIAYIWAQEYRLALLQNPLLRLAFDIETPGKGEDEDGLETDGDAPDKTWHIFRIGFSYAGLTALSIPWEPQYIPAIRLLLGSSGEKVVWNAGFDVPRVRRAGVAIGGTIHDAMVAWHILHSDLPKSLKFVATFTCPWQPAWKHLSGSHPGFYNATDADVEWRSMEVIECELRRTGLWDVYQRDVLDLDPILVHMNAVGMPIDQAVREDRAIKLAAKLAEANQTMAAAVPLEARRIDRVYRTTPKDTRGLMVRPGLRTIKVCPGCGQESPKRPHFKKFVKKTNLCADLTPVERDCKVDEYYRLSDFKPSRDQLIRYHNHLKRPLPMIYDKATGGKKVSFAEGKMKELMLKYPADPLYQAVLQYRSIDKLAGTYIGRPSNG